MGIAINLIGAGFSNKCSLKDAGHDFIHVVIGIPLAIPAALALLVKTTIQIFFVIYNPKDISFYFDNANKIPPFIIYNNAITPQKTAK